MEAIGINIGYLLMQLLGFAILILILGIAIFAVIKAISHFNNR